MSALRVLQFGATGQVARALIARAPGRGVELTALDRAAADLSVPGAARRAVEELADAADLVVNAAAYTAVDAAEDEPDLAWAVNAAAPGEIAAACAARGIPLIHISTDYVFDGAKPAPYVETDPTGPLGSYGRSKLGGEQGVAAALPEHVILRTSWVYDAHGRNFVRTMLRLAEDRDELAIVEDQRGAPTAAGDIAETALTIARAIADGAGAWGVFHFTNAGETAWRGFAEAIFEDASWLARAPRVRPISTAEFGAPAPRPANSALDCAKIAAAYGVQPRPWREALREVLAEIGAEREATSG